MGTGPQMSLFTLLLAGSLFIGAGCQSNNAPLTGEWNYVVSPGGSDANSGTSSAPFKTIERALEAAMPGDTVVVMPGMYRELVKFPRSGKAGEPIVLKSAVPGGAVLEGTGVEVPEWFGLLTADSVSHIEVNGFRVENSPQRGIWIKGTGKEENLVLKNCQVRQTGLSAIAVEEVRNVQLLNCEASYAGNGYAGFYLFRNQQVLLDGCAAHHNGAGGGGLAQGFVFYEGADYQVKNCLAYRNNRDGFDTGGGEVGTQNISFTDCYSYQNGEDGFGLNSYAAHAEYLRCVSYGNGSNDFNFYQGVSDVSVTNCTMVGSTHYFWIDGSDDIRRAVSDIRILNCIGTDAGDRAIITIAPVQNIQFDYNCWTGNFSGYGEFCLWNMGAQEIALEFGDVGPGGAWFTRLGQGAHSFSADPLLVSVAQSDFHLTAASPCIDAGLDVGLPFRGSAPDLGAFEYTAGSGK